MVRQYEVQIINRQYRDIVKKFGAESQYSQPYTGRLIQMGAKPNKQGILQLPVYKKDIARYNTKDIYESNINVMRKLSNVQDIKKRVRQTLRAEGITPEGKQGQYTESQIQERVQLEGEIHEIIRELQGVAYNNDDAIKKIVHGVDKGGTNEGNLTQEDMQTIRELYNNLRQERIIEDLPF